MARFALSSFLSVLLLLLCSTVSAAPLPDPAPTPGWFRDKWESVKSSFGSSSSSSKSSAPDSSSSKSSSYSDSPPPYSAGAPPPSYEEATRGSSSGGSPSSSSSGSPSGGNKGSPSNTHNTYNNYPSGQGYGYRDPYAFGPSLGSGYNDGSWTSHDHSRYNSSPATQENKDSSCGKACQRNTGIVLGSIFGFIILVCLCVCSCRAYKKRPKRLSSLTAGNNRGGSFMDYFRKKKQKLSRAEFRKSLRRYDGFYSRRNRDSRMQQTNNGLAMPPPTYRPDGPSGTRASPYNDAVYNVQEVAALNADGARTATDDGTWQNQIPAGLHEREQKPYKETKEYGYGGSRGHMQEHGAV